ncbi:proline transporter 2-like [Senna tora]|uniref:Proline transporter 2-like n=1 Tax=Senna tora TaxID=362788 RepID=A0A834VWY2_9FABA|nr:proline transporter 2-like [Senna tora]
MLLALDEEALDEEVDEDLTKTLESTVASNDLVRTSAAASDFPKRTSSGPIGFSDLVDFVCVCAVTEIVFAFWAYGSHVSVYLPQNFSGPRWANVLVNALAYLQSVVSQHMFVAPIHEAFDTKVLYIDKGMHSKQNLKRLFLVRLLFFSGNTFVSAAFPFIVFEAWLEYYNEIELLAAEEGKSCIVEYVKRAFQRAVEAYLIEAKWCNHSLPFSCSHTRKSNASEREINRNVQAQRILLC